MIFNNSWSFDFVFAHGLRIFRSVILGEIKELNNFHQNNKYFFRFHTVFSIALGIVNDKRKVIGPASGKLRPILGRQQCALSVADSAVQA